MHLGDDDWMIIDSCRADRSNEEPASLAYLDALGVDTRRVGLVVVTHWHDDHIRGLAQVVQRCRKAKVAISSTFTSNDFLSVLHLIEPQSMADRSGVRDFWELWSYLRDERRPPRLALADRLLWDRKGSSPVTVHALSPSDADVAVSLQVFRDYLANPDLGKEYIAATEPNAASVVVWVQADDIAILSGGDLERKNDRQRGWLAVLDSSSWRPGPAGAFKVAHHGSENAHEPRVWNEMLSDPVAVVTPFVFGRHDLPTPSQAATLCRHTTRAFLSSCSGRVPLELAPEVADMVKQVASDIRSVEVAPGHVRLRRRHGATAWDVALSPEACLLCA